MNSKGLSYVTIKNKNNEVLYSNEQVVLKVVGVECTKDGSYIDKDIMNIEPIISNGKLYFVSLSNTCYLYKESNVPYYDYNYIDLNSSSLSTNVIKRMKLKLNNNYDYLCY